MHRARRTWGMVAVALGMAAAASVGGHPSARAQDGADAQGESADTEAAATAARPSMQFPGWMTETGRVAKAAPAGQADHLRAAESAQRQGENPVRVHASQAATSRAVQGRVNRAVMEMEAQPYLRELRACPIEVARRRQVPLSAIESGDLDLTFTIQPNGSVTGAQAMPTGEPDPELLTCVGQRMFGWRFTPPDGGPAKVDMRVSLHAARVVAPR